MVWKHKKEMNIEAKPRRLSLFRMFLDHDETRRTSVSYDWLLKLMGKPEMNVFVYDCGTRYSNCHLVSFHNKIDSFRS